VTGDDNRHVASAVDLAAEVEDLALGKLIETQGRLIEDNQFGFGYERKGQVGAHLLSKAQFTGGNTPDVVQAKHLGECAEASFVLRARQVPHYPFPVETGGDRVIPSQFGTLPEADADA
jgi:hypothetical protein